MNEAKIVGNRGTFQGYPGWHTKNIVNQEVEDIASLPTPKTHHTELKKSCLLRSFKRLVVLFYKCLWCAAKLV